ncbi:hypothetical protein F383_19401 [Gossypium arboreum]|uniref:Uncharacterized protein n=1 Tax=Gossypium arboreum TaxID=29729 RepID=A0A0B0NK59_GOSAR|nr:hypothetical protein F383_19401 [Gossypium arboreum]
MEIFGGSITLSSHHLWNNEAHG